MNGNGKNNLYKIYLIGFFLILALPVVTTPLLIHPPAWGKTIIFRIVLSILLFLFIYQILFEKDRCKNDAIASFLQRRENKVFWPFWLLIALWLIFLLATIFSLDPYFSLWDSPHRGGGFVNFSFYIIFAILTFLILRKKDWQKVWLFTISIGVLVSIIALFQQFNIFGQRIIYYAGRPPSTLGGPIFLALYLLLLIFITFSFFLKEKNKKIKIFYFFSFLLFIFVILLTGSRSAYFGLAIGFLYFILTYPKRNKLILAFKIIFLILIITGVYGVYYLSAHRQIINSIKYPVIQKVLNRFSISLTWEDPRFSAWLVSLKAIKEKPILGYGPENFSIAFDKHYDPSLPYISKTWGSWYDKAHNFIFEIAVTAGIPALIIYLSLFAALFWKLQKIKEKHTQEKISSHAIQAGFLAYLTTTLFSFNVFSTYLILFLIIGYSLILINPRNQTNESN